MIHNYILTNENAIYYECGFSCDNVIFLKLDGNAYFITDPRYTIEAKELVKNAEVIEAKRDLYKKAKSVIKESGVDKVYYDPTDFTVLQFRRLKKPKVVYKAAPNFSQKKRVIKTDAEIKLLKKAVDLGAEAFNRFAENIAKNAKGMSERHINFEALREMTNSGMYDLSFDPITAIDANAAKPHALPSDSKIKSDSLILYDAGLKYKRYCSDRTRTAQFSPQMNFQKEQIFKSKKMQKVYDIVLKAQEEAIKSVKVGVKACDIDKAGRDVIEKAGFGKYFIHSTGHGVGLDIHELPVISKNSCAVIEENMVFTIEPGIYLPDEFGVRIEDMVTVRSDGVEIL